MLFMPEAAWGKTPLGRTVVWGRGIEALGRGNAQAAQVIQDTLRSVYELGNHGRPVSYGDINGDGRSDLLLQDGLQAQWWTT